VTAPQLDFSFPRSWKAEVLPARPAILPARHFVYPGAVEEVERGALEVLVRPEATDGQPFLATCALGFRDPVVPTGLWSTPNPTEICAVSGGYAYLIDTAEPEEFTMLPYRPVLQVIPVPANALLLFVGNRTVLAWSKNGEAWESPKLSDEGITGLKVEDGKLAGTGWNMITDRETPFTVDLQTGNLVKA
jgi:hypothetical protein